MRFFRTKRAELANFQSLLPLLRPLLSSGSIRAVLEAAVAAAPLPAPSAAGSAAGRQKVETSQRNEDIGWKRGQRAKKKEEEEEEAEQPSPPTNFRKTAGV